MEEGPPNIKEKKLPDGAEIKKIIPEKMADKLKGATQMKWPFSGEIKGERPEANTGASTCLMGYVFQEGRVDSGHFTVVTPPPADSNYKGEYDSYTSWINNIGVALQKDKNAIVVLLGQHQSNLSSQAESRILGEIWGGNRKQVDTDLTKIGAKPENIIDLRGAKIGATAAVYEPQKKKLYYTEYPPRM